MTQKVNKNDKIGYRAGPLFSRPAHKTEACGAGLSAHCRGGLRVKRNMVYSLCGNMVYSNADFMIDLADHREGDKCAET